jgi:hypothetical protein
MGRRRSASAETRPGCSLSSSGASFLNDFTGRIANRVMQTSNAVRESVVSSIRAVCPLPFGVAAPAPGFDRPSAPLSFSRP